MHKKLLGIRICEHDSNISYFDGETLRYYKSERNKQIKHHGYDNVWEWKNDIEKLWNMNVNDIEKNINSRTKAIMVVHTYCLPVEMDVILDLARKYNLFIIEDAIKKIGLAINSNSKNIKALNYSENWSKVLRKI